MSGGLHNDTLLIVLAGYGKLSVYCSHSSKAGNGSFSSGGRVPSSSSCCLQVSNSLGGSSKPSIWLYLWRNRLLAILSTWSTSPMRGGIGRAFEGVILDQGGQGLIHAILADVVLQGVHDHAALVVVDVALAGLNPQQRLFFVVLLRASAQIAIQLVAQKLLHRVGAVGFFHDHERGVLGESFDDCGLAFGVGAYDLMSPLLMANLMRGDEEGQVDRVFLVGIDPGDEADALGKRDRIGKRLGKVAVARELDDAQLPGLEGTESGRRIIERRLHAQHHAVEIKFMAGMVVDFQIYVVPMVVPNGIARGICGEDATHDGRVGLVMEIASAILDPFFLQVAGQDGDLIWTGADGAFEIHPVSAGGNRVVLAGGHILELRKAR